MAYRLVSAFARGFLTSAPHIFPPTKLIVPQAHNNLNNQKIFALILPPKICLLALAFQIGQV
jgi:hypothetical protein